MGRARDEGGPGERPLRLRRSDEVRPLRLDPPIRLSRPAAPPPAEEREAAPERLDGAGLRRAREARGMSAAELARRTKLTRHEVESIEASRVDLLPPAPYLRGHLAAIAKELRLDPKEVARAWFEAAKGPGDSGPAR